MKREETQHEAGVLPPSVQGARKQWARPTVERQGSVTELVQISKQSGTHDCSGKKRNGWGC